ncbi:MAG: hypothetical protein ACSHX8_02480 [Opitutaceae bacterium]
MNIFSKERFLNHFRISLQAFFALFALFFSAANTHAQNNSDQFRGTWQIETPDNGALILIVKRNNLASYFWGDNADRTVYQGSWSSVDEMATLTWPDGTQHRIVRDSLGFGITHVSANQQILYNAPAQQVPKEILGQWAKPPSKSSEVASARDKATGFYGIWQVGDKANSDYVFVEEDRSAASTWGDERGLRGSWAKQGSELHISWDNGHYSILRENERSFAYKRIQSGVIIEEDETELTPAERVSEDNVTSTWLTNYKTEREVHTGGIAFSSRKNARAFYRGTWLARLGETKYERIEITRFGGLKTSVNSKMEGSWRLERQDLFMRWDNGSRRILSPVGQGFVIYEYKPGRPLDGVPTMIYPAAPEDASKLAEHMKGRKDVALQMLSLAEAAGINPAEQNVGWGRTFARWAWPFGEDETAAGTPNALLEEAYEDAPSDSDPWWWPFWSESNVAEVSTEAPAETTTETSATVEQDAPAAVEQEVDADEETEKSDKENKKSSKKDWAWPF